MNMQRALIIGALTVGVIAASRRVEATRNIFIPGVGDSLFSFLPWVD